MTIRQKAKVKRQKFRDGTRERGVSHSTAFLSLLPFAFLLLPLPYAF
jgi:hypothetical protein